MEEPMDTIAPTVTAPRDASSRLVWGLAAGILVLGLMLLNLESIGRLVLGAHGAPRARELEQAQGGRERAVAQVAAGDQAVPPAPATPVAEVVMAPSAGATTTAPAASPALPAPAAPPLERLYPAPVTAPAAAVRPAATPPASAPAVSRPAPDGRAGLVMLVRSGALRPASGNDLARWKARYASTNPRPAAADFDEWTRRMPVYEIVGDMTFPEGLGGANAAVFLLGERAPYPAGDPGHSVILDMASGSCIGVTCGMLLDD
ncbi:MAG: hypothetical protein J7507_11305 [Pseudoxanthomonas sp.]|nr:hypothetical protein [Pseudoxanthomonas sp.]